MAMLGQQRNGVVYLVAFRKHRIHCGKGLTILPFVDRNSQTLISIVRKFCEGFESKLENLLQFLWIETYFLVNIWGYFESRVTDCLRILQILRNEHWRGGVGGKDGVGGVCVLTEFDSAMRVEAFETFAARAWELSVFRSDWSGYMTSIFYIGLKPRFWTFCSPFPPPSPIPSRINN